MSDLRLTPLAGDLSLTGKILLNMNQKVIPSTGTVSFAPNQPIQRQGIALYVSTGEFGAGQHINIDVTAGAFSPGQHINIDLFTGEAGPNSYVESPSGGVYIGGVNPEFFDGVFRDVSGGVLVDGNNLEFFDGVFRDVSGGMLAGGTAAEAEVANGGVRVAGTIYVRGIKDHKTLYSLVIALSHIVKYKLQIQAQHVGKAPLTTQAQNVSNHSLLVAVKDDHSTIYQLATRVVMGHAEKYDIKTTTGVRKDLIALYSLLDVPSVVLITADPFVTVGGEKIPVVGGRVSIDEGNAFWIAELNLPDAVAWSKFIIQQQFTLDIYGESFAMMVDSKSRGLEDSGTSYSLSAVSIGALLDFPYAKAITGTWGGNPAKTVVDGILGQTVNWGTLINWTIPPEKVSVVNSSPWQAADVVVKAAGGVMQSKPDGTLEVRHLYPVPVPEFYTATPDHTYTGQGDVFSVEERFNPREGKNRFTLRNEAARNAGHFSAEVDNRKVSNGGMNRTNDFVPGDVVYFLVYCGPFVTVKEVITSDGTVQVSSPQVETREEFIGFSDTDIASVAKPIKDVVSTAWYGTSLGAVSLSDDRMTIKSASSGVGLLKITYTTDVKVYGLLAPLTSGGEITFPIKVFVVGTYTPPTSTTSTNGNMVVVTVVRGLGDNPGDEILESLGSTASVLVSRGRAEVDTQESKYDVTMNVKHRTGVKLGNLVEVQDLDHNEVWRAKIVGIEHQIELGRVVSTLNLEKVAPRT